MAEQVYGMEWGFSARRVWKCLMLELDAMGQESTLRAVKGIVDRPSQEVFEIAKRHDPEFMTMTQLAGTWESILGFMRQCVASIDEMQR